MSALVFAGKAVFRQVDVFQRGSSTELREDRGASVHDNRAEHLEGLLHRSVSLQRHGLHL